LIEPASANVREIVKASLGRNGSLKFAPVRRNACGKKLNAGVFYDVRMRCVINRIDARLFVWLRARRTLLLKEATSIPGYVRTRDGWKTQITAVYLDRRLVFFAERAIQHPAEVDTASNSERYR
jgi:hypothetical protein